MFIELKNLNDENHDHREKKLLVHSNSVRTHVLWLPTKEKVMAHRSTK